MSNNTELARYEVSKYLTERKDLLKDSKKYKDTVTLIGLLKQHDNFIGIKVDKQELSKLQQRNLTFEEMEVYESSDNYKSIYSQFIADEDLLELLISKSRNCPKYFSCLTEMSKDTLLVKSSNKYIEFLSAIARGDFSPPKKQRGRSLTGNFVRDTVIALAVYKAKKTGIPAYSNGLSDTETACTIVNGILQDEYNIFVNVVTIWQRSPYSRG